MPQLQPLRAVRCCEGAPRADAIRAAGRRPAVASRGLRFVLRREILRLRDVITAEHIAVLSARNTESQNFQLLVCVFGSHREELELYPAIQVSCIH